VLILGDTGTGKDMVARSIHDCSPNRHRQSFLAVNCGAVARELFESELFGYAPGAFTNALPKGSPGLWRSAAGGTIFLDEIGDLPAAHQVKLLRVLDQGAVRPVGASREVRVDARVIAATNRDLFSMVQTGEFREDLYYRLGSMIINLPRLRERVEDIPALAMHFWHEMAPTRQPLPGSVLKELCRYRWQGNARELRYILVNLHTTFPRTVPTVERLQTVMRMRLPERGFREDAADEALQRIDSLRHLRRAGAAIDACRRIVRAFGNGRLQLPHRNGLQTDLAACLTELQLLGARPERFPTTATFEMAHRLAGAMGLLLNLLIRNDPKATLYCRSEVGGHVKAAAAAVRREEERILRSL
jgi:transcriptional regulator with PAS, ATPase and Fis domain